MVDVMKFSKAIAAGRGAVFLCVLASAAHAHHSNTAFDTSRSVEWRVVVTEFKFVNPHAYVYFTMPDAAGKLVNGRCELGARTALTHLGWTIDTVKPGEKITVKGAPGRNEASVCMVNSLVRADGTEIAAHPAGAPTAASLASTATVATTHSNLQGYWVSQGGGPGGPPGAGGPPRGFPAGGGPPGGGRAPPGAGGPPPGAPPFPPGGGGGGARPQPSEAGIAAARDYEQPFDDPAIKCDIANIIFGWTHDQNVNEIIQTRDLVTLKYGYMDFVRAIHLDMSAHPAKLPLSRGGHSIGRWEGDTLVVDTVALAAGVLIPISGVMLSDQAHVVERFTLDAKAGTLTRAYVVEDPLYLKQPYAGRDVMAASKEPYTPYECVELSGDNNKRPVKQQ